MATQNPISTISYNTELFLREKLDAWYHAHIIQSYQYIYHIGEDGDKDHIHLRVVPNRRLDAMNLKEDLREYQNGKDKPLGVMDWRQSKEEDWLLYVTHYPPYMRIKYPMATKEKLPYDWTQIQVSDGYDLEDAWARAVASLTHSSGSILQGLKNGHKPSELIGQGENPFLVSVCYKALFNDEYTITVNTLEAYKKRLEALERKLSDMGYILRYDETSNKYDITGTHWEQVSVSETPFDKKR